MVVRIASVVLSLAGLFALFSGLLFWTGIALNMVSLHMLLGLLAVGALWTIGIAQAIAKGGSRMIAASAIFLGVLTVIVGLYQSSLMVGPWHWIMDVTHLLLGVLTIGFGHMGAARYRKAMSK